MSPEQAAGRWDELGVASDVYCLGATLFCVLTGKPPQQNAKDALQDIQEGRFPQPRKINPLIPAEMEAICVKSMALSPQDRYRSVDKLREDLEAWMADAPISVIREDLHKRLSREARQHPSFRLVPMYGLAFLSLLILSMDFEGRFAELDSYTRWILLGASLILPVVSAYCAWLARPRSRFSQSGWSKIRRKGRHRYIWTRAILWCFYLSFLGLLPDLARGTLVRGTLFFWGVTVSFLMIGGYTIATKTWHTNEAIFAGKGQRSARERYAPNWGRVLLMVSVVGVIVAIYFLLRYI